MSDTTAGQATRSGMFVIPAIERIVYGSPVAEVVPAEAGRLGAKRVFLMVSGTMNRNTDEVAKLSRALGDRHAGTFDAMPAFIGELGLPRRLAEVDVARVEFGKIAEHTMHDEWLTTNPRKIDRIEQVMEILEAAA